MDIPGSRCVHKSSKERTMSRSRRQSPTIWFCENPVIQVESAPAGAAPDLVVYAAVATRGYHWRVADSETRPEPELPGAHASRTGVMRCRIETKAGRTLCKLRQQTKKPGRSWKRKAMLPEPSKTTRKPPISSRRRLFATYSHRLPGNCHHSLTCRLELNPTGC